MQDTWHIVKWVYVAVLSAYLVVQVLATRRLKGDQKKRCCTVLTVMLVLMFGSDAIRDVFFFENYEAGQVGMVIVAVAAIVAMILLARMFGESASITTKNHEDYVQPLKLS